MSDLNRISNNDIETGRKSSIGTSAVQLTTSTLKGRSGVQIKASADNSGIVYVAKRSTVTADSADATDGYPLSAGESILFPARSPDQVYVIGSASGQKVFWVIA